MPDKKEYIGSNRLSQILTYIKEKFDGVDTNLSTKVDKVNGKALSTNDFTDAFKTKLEGVATGAEVNVQSDWDVTDTNSDAFILHKPTIPTVNNSTITIQKNGTNVDTFTLNQSSAKSINITVPTKVSELTNDSGYTTNVGTITGITMNGASKGTSGVVDLGTVITSHQDISGKFDKTGGTITGETIIQKEGLWVQGGSAAGGNYYRLITVGGMPEGMGYNQGKRGTRIYSNGIAFLDPYNGNSNNDSSWIRHIEETANTGTLEIAVGDDNANEVIAVRRYNTSNNIAKEILLFDTNGNTSFPGTVTANKFSGDISSGTGLTKSQVTTALGYTPPTSDTDTKVTQTVTDSTYENWRPVLFGASNGAEGFAPSTVTDGSYTNQMLSFNPKNGILRASTFRAISKIQGEFQNEQYVNLSSLNTSTWYPVTGTPIPTYNWGMHRLCVHVALNSSTVPSWSTHQRGFSVDLDMMAMASGWGTSTPATFVLNNTMNWIATDQPSPAGYSQMTNSSTPVFWLRGGGNYYIYTDYSCVWTVRTSSYTTSSNTVTPTTTYPGISLASKGTITANLDGNATYATTAGSSTSATKATQDGDGNVITSTYLKLSGGTMAGTIVTPKDDTKGLEPAANNWGRIGSSDKYYCYAYITSVTTNALLRKSTSSDIGTSAAPFNYAYISDVNISSNYSAINLSYLNSNYPRFYAYKSLAAGTGWRVGDSVTVNVTGLYFIVAWAVFTSTLTGIEGVSIRYGGNSCNQNVVNMNYGQNITLTTCAAINFTSNTAIAPQAYSSVSQAIAVYIVAFKIS